MKKRNRKITAILSVLVVLFIIITCYFIIPTPSSIEQALFPVIAVFGIAFCLLGIALIILTVKAKIKGSLKKFLILTGVSATLPLIGSVLHNFFYALGVITSHITVLSYLFEILHAAFFIIALLISPIAFLIGVIGSIFLLRKNKVKSNA